MDASLLDAITAIGSILTAIGTGGLVVVAHKTLTNAGDQLGHLRHDSAQQTRPYVYLEVVPGLQGSGSWDLRIKNLGASLAHNVQIDVGELEPLSADDRIVKHLAGFFRNPLTLPPAAHLRVVWRRDDASRDLLEGAPEVREVSVGYKDVDGNIYKETYTLSLVGWGQAMPAPQQGDRRNSGDNRELADIAHAIRALNTHAGEIRR